MVLTIIFVVMAKDKADAAERRKAHLNAHRGYLSDNTHPVRVLISGPLVSDADPDAMIGSFFMVEADGRAAVEAWNRDDPMADANVWQSVAIEAFHKRVDTLSAPTTP